ncbi:unnamed protein product [Bursaphelenchus xylophilus]|uniref:DDRGK domain-containing protein 1 n=1 Tax=Bursaphelenchus xylophilus TaxID=6326 RepID=A0A1I7SSQ3_BURXY|nr:unnamed protein product [Bursaphelenchus xylophilus]CAG9108920.1 unnamed protein product [Bursaphelenchus xylophilus]
MDRNPEFKVPSNDSLMYLSIAFLGTVFTVILGFAIKTWMDERESKRRREIAAEVGGEFGRIIAGTNARNDDDEDGDDDYLEGSGSEEDGVPRDAFEKKVGKKKLAKLQAKQEAKAAREAMLAERADKKRKEEEEEQKRQKEREIEEEKERKEEEERKKLAEEKAAREREEYLKMKEAFAVEEEGFDEVPEADAENLLNQFVDYCRTQKVVNIDDLASIYKLKVGDVAERIQTLIETERLHGVVDDRGKFIYITQEEFDAVAKFINQRGRVTVQDLVSYSNRLISLMPTTAEA